MDSNLCFSFLKEFRSKNFEPQSFEEKIYELWRKNRAFVAIDNPLQKNVFCMVLPPPNVTGVLHIGHALTSTIQDILIRWRRMCKDNVLWLPGTDHAGIATQIQVEKAIEKKSGQLINRHTLGREKFLEQVWEWKAEHEGKIKEQLCKMGCSLDWTRERFTLDEGFSKAVREAFVRLYEQGLIYQGVRLVNWCPHSQTALSDLEVIPTRKKGHLWSINYSIVEEDGTPLKNSNGQFATIKIATTRPETLLGDTAVAVHPEDPRYQCYHGKKVCIPLINQIIPLILDTGVDQNFGTGALKVTPAHDFHDYEIAQRHQLPFISVINTQGEMSVPGSKYHGLKVKEAREKITNDLKEQGFLSDVQEHVHYVGVSQRSGEVVEPLLLKQWFVKTKPLAKLALEAVERGEIQFLPQTWEKTYFNWMENIRDWCISRQLWWGHQIPVWYCQACQYAHGAHQAPACCSICQHPDLVQDEDVLDTWFSAALWPFATLGWPEKTDALKTFYPISVLETGFDIIFFWVARMIMMGIYLTKQVPFKKVYLHAMIRDEKGEKMSKTRGNVIDPLQVIDQYGADPLRFTLARMSGQGRDIKLSIKQVEGYRAFCNKLWNAVKYFFIQLHENQSIIEYHAFTLEEMICNVDSFSLGSQWILSQLQKLIQETRGGLETFHFNEATQSIYQFTWHEFCNWFIEWSKLESNKKETILVLGFVLEEVLKLLHPFMPFITEELWQMLNQIKKRKIELLMLQEFPRVIPEFKFSNAEIKMEKLQLIVNEIRNFRGIHNIPSKKIIPVFYQIKDQEIDRLFRENYFKIEALSRSKFDQFQESQKNEAIILLEGLELRIPLNDLIDANAEMQKMNQKIEKINQQLEWIQKKMNQPYFFTHAPKEFIEAQKMRKVDLENQKSKLMEAQRNFGKLEK